MQWLLTSTPLLYLTQSIWRDEAFSLLVAARPISFFFGKLTFEPPVYYMLLHFWIKLFGNGEIAARSLSLLAFSLATVVVINWAEKLFKKHFLSWVLPILFFLNPMLLYYAFEVRTYGWYILFTVLSMYNFFFKRWKWYTITTVLGFYTHTYFIFVPAVQALYGLLTKKLTPKMKRSFIWTGVFIAPWLVKVALEASHLKSSWYYPVDLHLVTSVLGNLFLGYEGTPWFLWRLTRWLSLILFALFLFSLRPKETRARNLLFFLTAMIPLALVIGISFIKPLFVNRYLIPVTIAEVFLLAFAIEAIQSKIFQKIAAFLLVSFLILFNAWYPNKHPKLPIRETIAEINMLLDRDDVILAGSPLIFFESIYYSRDPSRVFLYNPLGSPFPWYVGDAIVSPKQITRELPPYPIRAFLVFEDGTFEITYKAL